MIESTTTTAIGPSNEKTSNPTELSTQSRPARLTCAVEGPALVFPPPQDTLHILHLLAAGTCRRTDNTSLENNNIQTASDKTTRTGENSPLGRND